MVPNCSPGHDASIGIQRDLPWSLITILFLWPLVTSILTWPKTIIYNSYRYFTELSNAVFCLSLWFVVFEIWRGRKGSCPISNTYSIPWMTPGKLWPVTPSHVPEVISGHEMSPAVFGNHWDQIKQWKRLTCFQVNNTDRRICNVLLVFLLSGG